MTTIFTSLKSLNFVYALLGVKRYEVSCCRLAGQEYLIAAQKRRQCETIVSLREQLICGLDLRVQLLNFCLDICYCALECAVLLKLLFHKKFLLELHQLCLKRSQDLNSIVPVVDLSVLERLKALNLLLKTSEELQTLF